MKPEIKAMFEPTKPREFWIRDFRFGDSEACSQECTVDLVSRTGKDWIHVREVSPEIDAAVEGMRNLLSALSKDPDVEQYVRRYCSDEIEAYDSAVKRGAV